MKSKKERVVEMNYVVTNDKLYIRLSSDGSPVTCSKRNAQVFEKDKADNILKNLPKVLKNFHFKVKPAPQSEQEVLQDKTKTDNVQSEEKKYIRKDSYIPCDEVVQWIENQDSVVNLWKSLREEEQYYIKNWQMLIVNCQTVCIRLN